MAQRFLFGSTASAATTFTTGREKPQQEHQSNTFTHKHLYAYTYAMQTLDD